jgi:hypothetical protein
MAYRIYEVDGLTDTKTLVEGEPYPDSDMALTDRRWLIKAQEEEWMRTGEEITKYYQIIEDN